MAGPLIQHSSDMLRRLEPAVRPGAAGAPTSAGKAALFESRGFDDLLSAAFAGDVRSERPVATDAVDLHPPLELAQLRRLAVAADRAEAFGARQALMMLDGRGLVVDVAARSVVAEMMPHDVDTMLRVDAALVVPGEDLLAGAQSRGSPFAGLQASTASRVASMHVDPSISGQDVAGSAARKPR